MRRRSAPSSPTSCAAGARSCGPPEQKMIEGVTYTPAGAARNYFDKGLWIDLTAGIIPVCSVPQYREVEIGQLARLSGATLYFVQADFSSFDLVGFARGMQEKLPSLRHLIVARGRTDDQKRLIQSISLEAARRRLSQVKLTPEDCFVFQLSGGSTGVPKIIPRFHEIGRAHV